MTGIFAVVIGPQHQKAVVWILVGGFVAAILAFALPRVILAIDASKRVRRICVRAARRAGHHQHVPAGGTSLQECLGYVGRGMMAVHADLGFELLIVDHQTDINSFEFALQQFAARIDAPEIVALASLVTQNQRLGAGIMDSIREFADTLRLKRRPPGRGKGWPNGAFSVVPRHFLPSAICSSYSRRTSHFNTDRLYPRSHIAAENCPVIHVS